MKKVKNGGGGRGGATAESGTGGRDGVGGGNKAAWSGGAGQVAVGGGTVGGGGGGAARLAKQAWQCYWAKKFFQKIFFEKARHPRHRLKILKKQG